MLAKDLMQREVVTIRDDRSVEDLKELLVSQRIHGVPVVDREGVVVGIVTQQDVFVGAGDAAPPRPKAGGARADAVSDLMTSPAVTAAEDTEVRELCRLMSRLRIHRVPITRDGKIAGIVSSLDICAALAEGRF